VAVVCETMRWVAHTSPGSIRGKELLALKRWLDDHFKLAGTFLLILAGLNGWISYTIFPEYPIMAAANAVMAGTLAVGVILSWRSQ
jgi:hypothetical protein